MKYTVIKHIIWITALSVAYMWLIPWGSFDPTQVGFYMCIVLAAFCEITIPWMINKNKVKDNKHS